MKTNDRKRLSVAVDNALLNREVNFLEILENQYSSKLTTNDKKPIVKLIKQTNKTMKTIQSDIINNGIVWICNGESRTGYWKRLSESNTAKNLICPILEGLLSVPFDRECTDGKYRYDTTAEGDALRLVIEYKAVGAYWGKHKDVASLDALKERSKVNYLVCGDNSGYLKAKVRNQVVGYLNQSADCMSSYGAVLVSNGIWYSLLLTGDAFYTDDELVELQKKFSSNLNGNKCNVLKNTGVPIMTFSIFDKNVDKKLLLLKYFLEDYLDYTDNFKDIISKLTYNFKLDVLKNLE